jgi:hypothetical protein
MMTYFRVRSKESSTALKVDGTDNFLPELWICSELFKGVSDNLGIIVVKHQNCAIQPWQ